MGDSGNVSPESRVRPGAQKVPATLSRRRQNETGADGAPSMAGPAGSAIRPSSVLLAEAIHATAGVDDLLLARVEGMTARTHFDLQVLPSVERVSNVLPQLQVTVIVL
jgi:hypothetical protein